MVSRSPAATLTWTGLGGNPNFATAANWSPMLAPVAGDTLIFAGSTGPAPQSASSLTVAALNFGSSATAFTIGGAGLLTVNSGGVTNSSAAVETIQNAIKLGAAQTWNASAGDLLFSGNINNNGFLLTTNAAKNITLNGNVSGTGGLTKTGLGTLTLSGTNSYSGTSRLSAGTVAIGSDNAFGSGTVMWSGAKIASTAGSYAVSNAITLTTSTTFTATNALTFSGPISMSTSPTVTVSGAGVITFGGTISQATGSRRLTIAGPGTLILNGANTHSGGTTLSSGILELGNNTAAGTGPLSLGTATLRAGGGARTIGNAVSLAGNTTFAGIHDIVFTGAATLTGSRTLTINIGNVTFSNALGQSSNSARTLTKSGAGTLTLSGSTANTYNGPTRVNDGRIVLAKTAGVNAFGGTTLAIGDGVGAANSAIVQHHASNQIPNPASITLAADGRLDLQSFSDTVAALTTTGGSIVGSGLLGLGGNVTATATGSNVTTISAPLSLHASRTFTINNNSSTTDVDLTVSGVIGNGSANSGLTKAGLGTLLLSGANAFSGSVSVNNGALLIAGSSIGPITSGPLGTGAVDLGDTSGTNSASLLFHSASGFSVANAITVRSGTSGTLTLGGVNTSGVNTFSGAIALSHHLVVTAATGGEVDFNGVISGNGFGLTKTGAGTVKLGAPNTFTGLTTVSAGTLAYGVSNALASGAATISSGATLDLNGFSGVIGSLAGAGRVVLGSGTLTAGGNHASTAFSGAVSGAGSLFKTGAGTMTLSGANSYTGETILQRGTLAIDSDLRLGQGGRLRFAGGTLRVTSSVSTSRAVQVDAEGGTIDSNGHVVIVSGSISGTLDGFTKIGTGTLKITGHANAGYTATTTVVGGSLDVGGDIGGSAITVGDSGTLEGVGITGSVTVLSGGTVEPGSSGAGILHTRDFSLGSGARLALEIGGTTFGTQYDQLSVTGGVTLAGDLQGTLLNAFIPAHDSLFFLIANDGTDAVGGTFAGLPQGAQLDFGGQIFVITYLGDLATQTFTGGNDVAIRAVPEPNTSAMFLGAAGLIALRRRRGREGR